MHIVVFLYTNMLFCAAPKLSKEILASPQSYRFQRALQGIAVMDPQWLEWSELLSSNMDKGLEYNWIYDIHGPNKLLSDDPYEIFQESFFSELVYTPKWTGMKDHSIRYIRAFVKENDLNQAILYLQKLEKKYPFNLFLLFNLAHYYEKLSRQDLSIDRLLKVLNLPINVEDQIYVNLWMIRLLTDTGDFKQAEKHLTRVIKIVKAQLKEARDAHFEAKSADRERLALEYLKIERKLAELLNYKGLIQYKQNKLVLAFEIFQQLEQEFPGVFVYAFNKNKIYLERRIYESALIEINAMILNMESLIKFFENKSFRAISNGDLIQGEKLAFSREYFDKILSRLLTRKGEILYREKLYDQALFVLRKSVERNSSDWVSWHRIADIQLDKKEYQSAIFSYKKVVQYAKKDSITQVKALELIDKVFAQEAIETIQKQNPLTKLRDEFFQNMEAGDMDKLFDLRDVFLAGEKWLTQGKYEKIIFYFKKELVDNPNVLEFSYYLARAYQDLNQAQLAKYYFKKALQLDPNHMPSLYGLIYFVSLENRALKSSKILSLMRKINSKSHYFYAATAWDFLQKKNFEQAILFYQKAIEIKPRHGEHHYRLGIAYFKAKLHRFAVHKFEDARVAGYSWNRSYLFEGLAYFYLGDFEQGIEALKQAAISGKDHPKLVHFAKKNLKYSLELLSNKFVTLKRKAKDLKLYQLFAQRKVTRDLIKSSSEKIIVGQTMEVVEKLKLRAVQDPDNLELNFFLAYIYLLLDRTELAEEYLLKSLDRNSMDYRAMSSLSEIYFRSGRLDQCVIYWDKIKRVSNLIKYSVVLDDLATAFLKLLDINPNDEWASYQYALLKVHTKKPKEAIDFLEKVNTRNRNKRTKYKDILLKLQAYVYYEQGVLEGKSEFINTARGLLVRAHYRYVDLIDIYKIGIKALDPISKKELPEIRVSDKDLRAYQSKALKRTVKRNITQTVALRSRPHWGAKWTRLDQYIARKAKEPYKSRRVLSSYDVYQKNRNSVESQYLTFDSYTPKSESDLEKINRENDEYVEEQIRKAISKLRLSDYKAAESSLLEAVNVRVDFSEGYFALLILYLVEGHYEKIRTLIPLLDGFDEYKSFLKLLEAHLSFQQGYFGQAKSNIMALDSKTISFPKNRIFNSLLDTYEGVLREVPNDFEASLKLGLLYMISAQFEKAELHYRRAGQYKGLIPYLSESLVYKAIYEKRINPAKEALSLMVKLSEVDKKEKWKKLARDMDSLILNFRFLAQ
ncbi:tetratricopeptide repeat protein [bacterium]|nr:tetratricopeptide repeat protein [bacterium]